MRDLLDQLEARGLRPGPVLQRLWELRKDKPLLHAIDKVMHCKLGIEGPDNDIPGRDPGFVPIAFVGNGDYYGLYVYPPARTGHDWQDPIVQHDHDGPAVVFEASSVEAWLARGIRRWRKEQRRASKADPASLLEQRLGLDVRAASTRAATAYWKRALPEEIKPSPGELERWLLARCPDPDGDLHMQERALQHIAKGDVDLRRRTRSDRAFELWFDVHSPATEDLPVIIRGFLARDARSTTILKRWCATYRWAASEIQPALRGSLDALGRALVATLAALILALQFDKALEAIERIPHLDALRDKLRALRADHERVHGETADENDWSNVAD